MRYLNIPKVFTVLVVLAMPLNTLESPIPSIELGTLLLLIMFPLMALRSDSIFLQRSQKFWLMFLIVVFVCSSISTNFLGIVGAELYQVIFRYLKIVAVVIIVLITGRDYFDIVIAEKTLLLFNYLCVAVLIIQTLGYYLFGNAFVGYYTISGGMLRPACFFYEPSNYAVYAIIAFAYLLYKENEKHRMQKLFFIGIGICLSTSGTGIILIPIVLITYFVLQFKKGLSNLSSDTLIRNIGILILIIIVIAIYLNSQLGKNTLGRFIMDDGSVGGAYNGRLESGASDLYANLPFLYKIIGCGFGHRPSDVYFPSIYAILYGDGVIGLFFLLLIFIYHIVCGNTFQRMLCVAFAVLMIGTGAFNFGMIAVYFSFLNVSEEEFLYVRSREED